MSIRFDQVSKSFGPKQVLNEVSFEAKPGEILFILGKSGVGKSVTLKHIVGVLKPDSGSVWIDGENVHDLDDAGLQRVRRKCGMVFQQPALLDSLTVHENIAFGLHSVQHRKMTESEISSVVDRMLGLVELDRSILHRYPPEISYGMQKRVSLARTVAPGPNYLLFDEPTTGLDPITTNAVNELIQSLSRTLKVTSLVVSHDMGCALKIADRILVLDQARILKLATPREMALAHEPLIRDFLSETLMLLEPAREAEL